MCLFTVVYIWVGLLTCSASATAEYVSREVIYKQVDLVLHVGDISYANGDPEVAPQFPPPPHCPHLFYHRSLSLQYQMPH